MKAVLREARALLERTFANDAILVLRAEAWSDAWPRDARPVDELETTSPGSVAGVLLGGWADGALRQEMELAASRVRPGGVLALLAPTRRNGLQGVRGAVLGLVSRRRPLPLEELCETMLLTGLTEIGVRELPGAAGYSLVWGRVRQD